MRLIPYALDEILPGRLTRAPASARDEQSQMRYEAMGASEMVHGQQGARQLVVNGAGWPIMIWKGEM